jgi:hypothetical protein
VRAWLRLLSHREASGAVVTFDDSMLAKRVRDRHAEQAGQTLGLPSVTAAHPTRLGLTKLRLDASQGGASFAEQALEIGSMCFLALGQDGDELLELRQGERVDDIALGGSLSKLGADLSQDLHRGEIPPGAQTTNESLHSEAVDLRLAPESEPDDVHGDLISRDYARPPWPRYS